MGLASRLDHRGGRTETMLGLVGLPPPSCSFGVSIRDQYTHRCQRTSDHRPFHIRGFRGPPSRPRSLAYAPDRRAFLTFHATFPDVSGLLCPVRTATNRGGWTPLLGFPKITPPSTCVRWLRIPVRRPPRRVASTRASPRLRSRERQFPTALRPRGFSPPRRLSPFERCRDIAPGYRSWGSLRFKLPRFRSEPFPQCSSTLRSFTSAARLRSRGPKPPFTSRKSSPRFAPVLPPAPLAFTD